MPSLSKLRSILLVFSGLPTQVAKSSCNSLDVEPCQACTGFCFMAEKTWQHFSVIINFEIFTDSRQTRFDTIYTGLRTNPEWRDIYAPLDGFVANAGIKIRL